MSGENGPDFKIAPPQSGFVEVNGPLYYRLHGGILTMALRVEPRHCNPAKNCHGAMLAGLADQAMALTAALQNNPRKMLVTISLKTDFLAPAPAGSWVETTSSVLRLTPSLAFVESGLWVGPSRVLRAHGMFSIPGAETPGYDLSKILDIEP
jgi:acyl-coenzyme A thioesterase 13